MTAVYTHSRPATRRQQLEAALAGRSAVVDKGGALVASSFGPVGECRIARHAQPPVFQVFAEQEAGLGGPQPEQ